MRVTDMHLYDFDPPGVVHIEKTAFMMKKSVIMIGESGEVTADRECDKQLSVLTFHLVRE